MRLSVLVSVLIPGILFPVSAHAWPRYASPVSLELRIPARHPYLSLTPELMERARQRAAASPDARRQVDRILADAGALIAKPLTPLPPRADTEHRSIGTHLFRAGLAYAFSGERRYAEWVRDGLLAYADLYPTLPLTRARNRLFTQSSLYESTWLVDIVQAYDLAAGAGVFSPAQAKHVEDDLLRPGAALFKIDDFENDPRIKDLHFRCYNFQAWHISAVGLAGLALGDRDLVDWAVNSPYGLRHLIGHDINDDGMFWERSEGYHDFVVHALLPFTEAMFHCGMDLYRMTVPADRAKDEESHYVTDTSDRPKSLHLLFAAPFYLTFPDLSYPTLGDSSPGPMRASAASLAAFNRYADPRLAWLINRRATDQRPSASGGEWQWLVADALPGASTPFPLRDGRFANTGEYRNGCSLFPSTGVAVLRQASGDYTAQPDSTAVSLSFGPHGGGHGHSDMLNLVLYAHGRHWLPDFGSMPYETHWKAEWTAHTVSHNTVVVDGVSQKPTGRRDNQWPSDTAEDRVSGVLERFDPGAKSVAAWSDRAYPGIRLRRAVRLDGSSAVDVFTAGDTARAEHQYDYVLHIDGQFEESSAPLAERSGKLGEACGYQLVEQRRSGTFKGPFHLAFARDGRRLRIWSAGEGTTDAIVGEGLTKTPDHKMTMLVLRRHGPEARFLLVLEPVDPADAIRAVRAEKAAVVIESAHGARRVALP